MGTKVPGSVGVSNIWVQRGCAGLNLTESGLRADFGNRKWDGHSLSSSFPTSEAKGILRAVLGCSPLGLMERKAVEGEEEVEMMLNF